MLQHLACCIVGDQLVVLKTHQGLTFTAVCQVLAKGFCQGLCIYSVWEPRKRQRTNWL